jgi:hypothetical protein
MKKMDRRTRHHRRLVLAEAILTGGLVQILSQEWLLTHAALPPWARVLVGMLLVLGLFGGLLLWGHRYLARAIDGTHRATKRLPLALPGLVVHGAILVGLFIGYASVWRDDVGHVSTFFS